MVSLLISLFGWYLYSYARSPVTTELCESHDSLKLVFSAGLVAECVGVRALRFLKDLITGFLAIMPLERDQTILKSLLYAFNVYDTFSINLL